MKSLSLNERERAVNFHNSRLGTRIAAQISHMIYSTEILIVNTICIRGNMETFKSGEQFLWYL